MSKSRLGHEARGHYNLGNKTHNRRQRASAAARHPPNGHRRFFYQNAKINTRYILKNVLFTNYCRYYIINIKRISSILL